MEPVHCKGVMPMLDRFPSIVCQIDRYDVIVIGHLKWNPYFSENADFPPRGNPSTCTSTMIRGKDAGGEPYVLLVDPTLRLRPEDYYFDINRRTGLSPQDITHCFVTHAHYDHQVGLNYFPQTKWYAAVPVVEELKKSEFIDGGRIIGVQGEFLPGIYALPLPGHTKSLHGVAFLSDGLRVVVAGDGVMTKDHFIHETTMFEQDGTKAAETIRRLKGMADVVIPGHDNAIINIPAGGQRRGVPC